jgi:hypothetical protein
VEIAMPCDMVVFEGVEQPGVAQRTCRPGLVARPPIAVERNSDQLYLGDFSCSSSAHPSWRT